MKHIPPPSFRAKAVTLMEMLIAIAVVAALFALTLPGLSVMRSRSNDVRCLANLKQLGGAFAAHCGDNRGVLPYGFHKVRGYWSWQLSSYLPYNNGSGFQVYLCPTEEIQSQTPGRSNYIANPFVLPDGQKPLVNRIPLTAIQRPTEVVILFDGSVASTGNCDWGIWAHPEVTSYTGESRADRPLPQGPDGTGSNATLRWRHHQSTHCLFIDGHVRPVQLGQLCQKHLQIHY